MPRTGKSPTAVAGDDERRVVVRVSRDVHRALRLRAVAEDRTVAEIAREVLGRYLREAKSA